MSVARTSRRAPLLGDPHAVAKRIHVPLFAWIGNCHAIAHAVLLHKLVPGGKLRYGHWTGPVGGKNFSQDRILRHGWIEVPHRKRNGKLYIVDPTRWTIEDAEPYIYRGLDTEGYYDVGGALFRLAMMGAQPIPQNDGTGRQTLCTNAHVLDLLHEKLLTHAIKFSTQQLSYVANTPPNDLGNCAAEFYAWLQMNEHKALIPIDFWDLVMT